MEQQLRQMPSVAAFPWTVYLVIVAAAGILALSRVHAAHDADTLLWGLISLDRLMPFYWQDNRIGTLVPWIASLVRDPYANLQLQVFVWSLGTLLCPVLLGALILRTQTTKALAAAQLGLVYLALAWLYRLENPRTQVVLFLGHPHGLGLALALGTLLFARTVLLPLGLSLRAEAPLLFACLERAEAVTPFFAGLLADFRAFVTAFITGARRRSVARALA